MGERDELRPMVMKELKFLKPVRRTSMSKALLRNSPLMTGVPNGDAVLSETLPPTNGFDMRLLCLGGRRHILTSNRGNQRIPSAQIVAGRRDGNARSRPVAVNYSWDQVDNRVELCCGTHGT